MIGQHWHISIRGSHIIGKIIIIAIHLYFMLNQQDSLLILYGYLDTS